jgi:hypothetical protein
MWFTIEDHADAEFLWGVNDCCLFVARVIDAMTDTSHELDLASQYSDEATALAYIASHGSLETAVSFHLGNPSSGRAQRGDAVMCANNGNPCIGICVGSTVACVGESGLRWLPRSEILTRWTI